MNNRIFIFLETNLRNRNLAMSNTNITLQNSVNYVVKVSTANTVGFSKLVKL